MSERQCPIPGCGKGMAGYHAMCKDHWFSVPRQLRHELLKEYRKQPGSVEHYAALRKALEVARTSGRAESTEAEGPLSNPA